MQESLIKELYYNFVGSSELTRKYHLLVERADDTAKQLRKVMNKKNKKKLERLCDDYEEIISLEVDNAFCDGFAFATQLLSEAYTRK